MKRDCRKSPVKTNCEFLVLIRNVDPFFGTTFICPRDSIKNVFRVSKRIRPEIPSRALFLENKTFNCPPMKERKLIFGYFFTIRFHQVLS